jgi:hypothetical protein
MLYMLAFLRALILEFSHSALLEFDPLCAFFEVAVTGLEIFISARLKSESCLPTFLMLPWAKHIIFLHFSFLTYKTGETCTSKVAGKIKRAHLKLLESHLTPNSHISPSFLLSSFLPTFWFLFFGINPFLGS